MTAVTDSQRDELFEKRRRRGGEEERWRGGVERRDGEEGV